MSSSLLLGPIPLAEKKKKKKNLRSYKTPERQGAGEGATRDLEVSPECTHVVAKGFSLPC